MFSDCLIVVILFFCVFFFFKQKPAYEMRIRDWSSDVCSSDLWLALDEKGRRKLLAAKVVPAPIVAIPAGLFQDNKPNRIGIEWYASPADLARVMDWLRRHTETGPAAEARPILGLKTGPPPGRARGCQ